jgi:hypothetical protein
LIHYILRSGVCLVRRLTPAPTGGPREARPVRVERVVGQRLRDGGCHHGVGGAPIFNWRWYSASS